jgi:hypothetical protein
MRLIHWASLISCTFVALHGCGADDPDSRKIKVFKSDNSKQCEDAGIALADMKKELSSAGIDVICSQKGNTGMAQPAVCGGSTGNINVYLIHTNNLPDAEKLGFASVHTLPEYKDSECVN